MAAHSHPWPPLSSPVFPLPSLLLPHFRFGLRGGVSRRNRAKTATRRRALSGVVQTVAPMAFYHREHVAICERIGGGLIVARLPDRSAASDPLPGHLVCPACSVTRAVLAYEDHWKRVFRCLHCGHLWHTTLPSRPAPLKPASPKSSGTR